MLMALRSWTLSVLHSCAIRCSHCAGIRLPGLGRTRGIEREKPAGGPENSGMNRTIAGISHFLEFGRSKGKKSLMICLLP